MKKVEYRSKGGVEAIEGWIKSKNLLARWIPYFMKRYKRKTIPSDILNKMAWGVVSNRVKRSLNNRSKQRKWYNSAKSGAINDLYNQVASVVPDEAIRLARERMEDKVYQQNLKYFRAYAKAKGR